MNNDLRPITTLPPFKRMCMTIGELPTSYLETMTYYEMLVWFTEYMKNTIIPTINNNGLAVEELQNKYIELKSYVDNYFDNLDVQEEINNKLDEMAEDGSLTNLIKDYVDPIYQAYEEEINEEITTFKSSINTTINNQNTEISNFKTLINGQVSQIDNKVDSATSGSPKGVYSTLSDLQTADPDHDYIYVVTADGKWYYYDTSLTDWTAGGTYQATEIEDGSISYKLLDELLEKTNPFNNLFEPFIVDNDFNCSYQVSNNGTVEIVDRPVGMNCTDTKVLKITMPNQNALIKIFPKFKQITKYNNPICFSHYLYNPGNVGTSYYLYNGDTSVGSQTITYHTNKFTKITSFSIADFKSNDNLNIRFFNNYNGEIIVYMADNCCIYGTNPIDKNIGYDLKTLPNDIIPSFENGKVGVGFGDSIMEGYGVLTQNVIPTKDCISIMSKLLNVPIYNGGIAGAKLSDNSYCSFVDVVDSIVNNDWTTFKTEMYRLISDNPVMSSVANQYAKIRALDFDNVDFLVIAYGTNDWAGGNILDNPNSPMNKGTILGALRYCVSTLLTAYPNLKLYVFTPCYRDHLGTNQDQTSDTYVNPTSGLTLPEVCDGIAQCCKELHIPCKNMYYESNLNQYTRDEYLSDYVHRNEKGYKLLGEQYAKFVNSN